MNKATVSAYALAIGLGLLAWAADKWWPTLDRQYLTVLWTLGGGFLVLSIVLSFTSEDSEPSSAPYFSASSVNQSGGITANILNITPTKVCLEANEKLKVSEAARESPGKLLILLQPGSDLAQLAQSVAESFRNAGWEVSEGMQAGAPGKGVAAYGYGETAAAHAGISAIALVNIEAKMHKVSAPSGEDVCLIFGMSPVQ